MDADGFSQVRPGSFHRSQARRRGRRAARWIKSLLRSFYRTISTAARSKKQQEALSRASIEGFGAGCVEWQPASRKLNRP
jgi:hypothetical protein